MNTENRASQRTFLFTVLSLFILNFYVVNRQDRQIQASVEGLVGSGCCAQIMQAPMLSVEMADGWRHAIHPLAHDNLPLSTAPSRQPDPRVIYRLPIPNIGFLHLFLYSILLQMAWYKI